VIYSIVLGLGLGFFVPPAISLILDYFPVKRQTTAMAVFGIAEQFAAAIVNTVTVFITASGWVNTYIQISAFFIGLGVIGLLVVREPTR
jgi:MFS family permease